MLHVRVIWIIFCKQSWDASDSTQLAGQLERKNNKKKKKCQDTLMLPTNETLTKNYIISKYRLHTSF